MWKGQFMPVFLLSFGLSPFGLMAQRVAERTVISGEASCGTCRIQLEHVARLGGDPQGYLINPLARVSKDSRGRWFVFGAVTPYQVNVFGFDGAFLQSFGRDGQGPGEFRVAVTLNEYPKDILNVWDWGNGRISRFTADFDYIDQLRLAILPINHLFTTEGQLVINAAHFDGSGEALPLHFIGSDGRIISSFGTEEPPYPKHPGDHAIRVIAPGRTEGIWAGTLARYELCHWNREGKLTHRVEREVSWFRPHSDPGVRSNPRDPRPNPMLRAIREDANGRLWTAVYVPQEDWRSGFRPDTTSRGTIWLRAVRERQYDTRVEVLDPSTGTALADITIPVDVRGFADAGPGEVFLYAAHESAVGELFLDIWLVRLIETLGREGDHEHE
jgi:hypothetical protein